VSASNVAAAVAAPRLALDDAPAGVEGDLATLLEQLA
jgi:hypothetical protein